MRHRETKGKGGPVSGAFPRAGRDSTITGPAREGTAVCHAADVPSTRPVLEPFLWGLSAHQPPCFTSSFINTEIVTVFFRMTIPVTRTIIGIQYVPMFSLLLPYITHCRVIAGLRYIAQAGRRCEGAVC